MVELVCDGCELRSVLFLDSLDLSIVRCEATFDHPVFESFLLNFVLIFHLLYLICELYILQEYFLQLLILMLHFLLELCYFRLFEFHLRSYSFETFDANIVSKRNH